MVRENCELILLIRGPLLAFGFGQVQDRQGDWDSSPPQLLFSWLNTAKQTGHMRSLSVSSPY